MKGAKNQKKPEISPVRAVPLRSLSAAAPGAGMEELLLQPAPQKWSFLMATEEEGD